MMKKTIFILTALAALACTAISCRKEFAEMQPGTGFTVTATIAGGGTAGNGTKVSATDDDHSLALKWEQGDKLIGFDDASPRNTYGFEVTSVDGGKATLTRIEDGDEDERGTATTDPADGTMMYMLYVPGKEPGDIDVTTNPANPSLTVDISRQTVKVPVLMTAQGTVQNGTLTLNFAVRTALIGVKAPTMATENEQYSSIVLTSTGTLHNQVKFDLSGTGGTLNATYSQAIDGTTSELVTSITKETSFSSGSDKKVSDIIYIAACPFSQDAPGAKLTFTAVTTGDDKEALTKEGITSVDAGKYYHISPTFASSGRTITVSFGAETANFFGGGSLNFSTSEKIRVYSSATDYEDIDVLENAASVTFTTKREGQLTFAYPADLTVAGEIAMTVPASQNSTTAPGASDLRAMATIDGNATEAVLENWTPIFKITLPDLPTITKLEIKSLPSAVNQVGRTGLSAPINTEGTDKTVVTISPTSGYLSGKGIYYVFLKGGVKLSDLAFNAVINENMGSMAGIPNKEIIGRDTDYDTANTPPTTVCFEIPLANFHYYRKVGTYKWATMNIGATSEDSNCLYFAWGEVEGHDHTTSGNFTSGKKTSAFDFSSFVHSDSRYSKCSWDATKGFGDTYCNTPYYDSSNSSWWKYNSTDGKTILHLMDDAAFYNWGGPWGIPTPANFTDLKNNANGVHETKYGVTSAKNTLTQNTYGYSFESKTASTVKIFFPNGRGGGVDLMNRYSNNYSGGSCFYPSNTLSTSDCTMPSILYVNVATTKVVTIPRDNLSCRHYGFPIRPVSTY